MVMDAIVREFAKESPVTLMARVALQKAVSPEWVDALFE